MKIKKIIIFILIVFLLIDRNTKIDYDDFNKLKHINKDIIGIINFSTYKDVVLQTNNNRYYMNHNPYKNNSYEGSIFLDYRNKIEDKILIIYGHNSRIVNTTFSNLEKYYEEDFYKNNQIITLKLENKINIYRIFSIFIENSNFNYINLNINNYYNHYQYLKNKSIYKNDININKNDKILILQTCSYEKENSYLIIVSKLIESKIT